MNKNNIIIFAVLFFIIIVAVGAWYWFNDGSFRDSENNRQNQENGESDLIEARYDNKIVYNNQADLERVKNDCAERGGVFDDCGSVCPPQAEICIEVCGKVCFLDKGGSENNDIIGEGLLDYNNATMGFSLKYPRNTEVKEETENRIEFMWLGSQQELGTEITDGLRILVSMLDLPARTSLKEHLQEKIDEDSIVEQEIISDVELENQYDYVTYSYVVSSLGEYRHLIAPINSQKYFDISVFVSHDYYQDVVDEILKTFEIIDAEKISSYKTGEISVSQPLLGQDIESPLKIEGQAIGAWFFEEIFKVTLVDWDGRIIAESNAVAKNDWMTDRVVPFEATLEFEKPENLYSSKATLIFEKSNPSGLPENNESLEYFVYFN